MKSEEMKMKKVRDIFSYCPPFRQIGGELATIVTNLPAPKIFAATTEQAPRVPTLTVMKTSELCQSQSWI